MIIGLVGGVASGKSRVAALLVERGAQALDADRLGHEVLKEPEVIAALCRRWGDDILRADGSIERSRVAQRVFAPPPDGPLELEFLEQVTHPRIAARLQTKLEAWKRDQPTSVMVLDAALLLKAGWDRWCDVVVYVDCPVARRRDWAVARGWSEQEFATREAAQGPLDQKRQRAHYVIDNSGTATELAERVARFWSAVVQPAVA